jgi:hypothetical protein
MTKSFRRTELTPFEKESNKAISKVLYIVEQYWGISHLHNNAIDALFRFQLTDQFRLELHTSTRFSTAFTMS